MWAAQESEGWAQRRLLKKAPSSVRFTAICIKRRCGQPLCFLLITATILTPFISDSKKKTESARTTLHNNYLRRLVAASLFPFLPAYFAALNHSQSAFDWPGFPTRYPLSISFWFLFQLGLWESHIHLGEMTPDVLRTIILSWRRQISTVNWYVRMCKKDVLYSTVGTCQCTYWVLLWKAN